MNEKLQPILDNSYLVGGAVRDILLNIKPSDFDYLVIDHEESDMINAGFKKVGSAHDVFILDNQSKEYSLPRKPANYFYKRYQKAGKDYDKQYDDILNIMRSDLYCRDFTINSMLMDKHGKLFDPFDGKKDLKNKLIKQNSENCFLDDPIRILRAFRLCAKYDFNLDGRTANNIRSLIKEGILDNLTPERVWNELSKGLMTDRPSKMFYLMKKYGALKAILPEVYNLFGIPQVSKYHPEIDTGVHTMMAVDYSAKTNLSLSQRFGVLVHDLGKALTPKEILPKHHNHEQNGVSLVENLCDRLKVDRHTKNLSMNFCKNHTRFFQLSVMNPGSVINLFEDIGAYRNSNNLLDQLDMAICDKRGRSGIYPNYPIDFRYHFSYLFDVSETIDKASIAKKFEGDGNKISLAIHNERCSVIRNILKNIQKD